MQTLVLLAIFCAVFYLIFKDKGDRFLAVLYGAAATVLFGSWFDFFNASQVYKSISFETLFLMFGMMLYSDSMAQTGVFKQTISETIGLHPTQHHRLTNLFVKRTQPFTLLKLTVSDQSWDGNAFRELTTNF